MTYYPTRRPITSGPKERSDFEELRAHTRSERRQARIEVLQGVDRRRAIIRARWATKHKLRG
jgi:hypothetical protein